MSYDPQTWADGEVGGTPITAARLLHMEAGIDTADAIAQAAQVSANGAQTTADAALAAAAGAEANAVPDASGVPDGQVLQTSGGDFGWNPPPLDTTGASAGQVPVSGGGEFWTWDEPPVSPHNHDDRYYTETESDARFAAAAHNHAGTYIPTTADVATIVKITQAAYDALVAAGTVVANRFYVIVG